ncbi:MAG: hypothetical protein IJZ36_00765 [Bacilli bacterium]|nr:hypothetical protein [Bacilli bacterium]
MNQELLGNDVAKEVLTILLNCSRYIEEKIPEQILKNLIDIAADSNIEVHLDKNKSLQEQSLSSEALDTFALLYYIYVANDKEKEEILRNWVTNDYDNCNK